MTPFLHFVVEAKKLHGTHGKLPFSPKLKEEWDQAVTKKEVSVDFEELRKYMCNRLLQMTPSSSSTSVTTPPSTATSSKPAKLKTPPKCPACDDKHGLLRCPVFAGFNVDRRNILVREKRLCINCFSDSHGFKACPTKFNYKTCDKKHHTLLHKEKTFEEASMSGLTTAPSVPDPADSQRRHTLSFLNTIVVKLSANGRIAQARAILDSGSGVSMISESLASTLKLQRFSEPMEIHGLLGQEHSKFSVVTELHFNTQDFTSKPITFTVESKLKAVQPPTNLQNILTLPQIKTLTLSDLQLG